MMWAVIDHLRLFCFPLGRADQVGAVALFLGSWTTCKLK